MDFNDYAKSVFKNMYNNDNLSLAILILLDKEEMNLNSIINMINNENDKISKNTIYKRLIVLKNFCFVGIKNELKINTKSTNMTNLYYITDFGKKVVLGRE